MAAKVILTGFMATGKSAVARALAKELGWPHLDCDSEIVTRAGRTIPQIFRDSGEAHFRTLEREVIAALAADQRRCPHCSMLRPAVIATGGGALVDPHNHASTRSNRRDCLPDRAARRDCAPGRRVGALAPDAYAKRQASDRTHRGTARIATRSLCPGNYHN